MIHRIMGGGLTCQQVAELSSAFVDGELTTTQWLRYRLHLAMCGPCQDYVQTMGLTVDALRDLPGEEGQDMRAQLMEAFDAWRAEEE